MAAMDPQAGSGGDFHAQVLAIMEGLELPAPERMLARMENMLGKEDLPRVLEALVRDSGGQDKAETKRVLKTLAGSREEWAAEVDRLLKGYPPT